MSTSNSWLEKVPAWVWCSLIPTFGALAIVYAGLKSNTSRWIYLGITTFIASLILSSHGLAAVIWIAQIATAFYLRKSFLVKTMPDGYLPLGDQRLTRSLNSFHGKLDINRCSKDELVQVLGLPIVYANDIEFLQSEGYLFTYLEELSEVAGLPESYLKRIEPLVIFTYDSKRDFQSSWRRANSFGIDELVTAGVQLNVAERIVVERQKGDFKSVLDLRKRTKVSFQDLEMLL